jgi:DNA-binding beta-propeller fold protein YncE
VVGFQDGPRRSAKFHFADNIPQRQVFTNVWGGLALDAVRNRLYVTDTMNRAIRMIDLSTDQVTTVARHGLDAVDGDARSVQLSNALAGLTVLPDGSLLICDRGNHVVRRLIVD